MDALQTLIAKIVSPLFYPFLPDQRVHVLYLGSALGLALLVFLAVRPAGGYGGLRGFLRFCFPKAVYRHPSAQVDYLYFLVNRAGTALLFAPMLIGAASVSAALTPLMDAFWGPAAAAQPGALALALLTAAALLAMDLGLFCAHYMQHKVPLLWEFHKVHHSAEVMTPITVYRMHPVDDLLSGSLVGLVTGVVHAVFMHRFGAAGAEFTVLKLNLGVFLFYLFGYNLRHSHIWLPYPGWLSHLLISPAQHQIHHSDAPRHFDRNLGFIFAFWDWSAGTLYVPRGREDIRYGLYAGEHRDYDSVWKLYALPFRKAAALLRADERERRA